jgi:small-conductance mechanosensitive channel
MEATTFWDQVRSLVSIEEPRAIQNAATTVQVLFFALATIFAARWASDRIRAAAKARGATADIASIVARTAAFAVFAVGIAIILSLIGLNPTAIAAVLGAAAVGISLAFQDVARALVNGVYVLVERPFRIGDRIRVDNVEGRVEEIGVRITRLRTDAGERVLLPNTLVFSSSIEKSTVGNYDRRRYLLTEIERPVSTIEATATQALKGTPHLSRRLPYVEVTATGPIGSTAHVTVEHDRGHRVDEDVLSRLRAEFPEATLTTRPLDDKS